jgi:hypothetical protein
LLNGLFLQYQSSEKLWGLASTVRPANGTKLQIKAGLTEFFLVTKLFKNWTYKLVSNASFSACAVVEPKEELEPWKNLSRGDAKHDVIGSGATLEGQSAKEARGGALSPSQASTHRDASGTIPIREIALFL